MESLDDRVKILKLLTSYRDSLARVKKTLRLVKVRSRRINYLHLKADLLVEHYKIASIQEATLNDFPLQEIFDLLKKELGVNCK